MARLFAHLPSSSSSFDFTNGFGFINLDFELNYGLLIRLFDFELVLIEGHEILCFTREQLLQLKEAIQVSGASDLFGEEQSWGRSVRR
ncbi:hypothetical protein IGI04_005928 [Brassica rapa subsp. trilocularis]|uniref:Uncharacterized protein n=1 Tax=Brassica rapa subsp. trilocularis TaxID=1813537 RepID=A0ABQ7NFF3_BRACM|nr:hypothetical protein IGI04_005928 [Brassica rapa subsp. trilocularis]